jgi:hypothetical protein
MRKKESERYLRTLRALKKHNVPMAPATGKLAHTPFAVNPRPGGAGVPPRHNPAVFFFWLRL